MSKNSLGELKLSPLKENGKFVFINNEIRVNGKLIKGDSIKIYVDAFEQQQGKYFMKGDTLAVFKITVRGTPLTHEHSGTSTSLDDVYNKACELYKSQFYFGKIEA
jgi:hypothetical protein